MIYITAVVVQWLQRRAHTRSQVWDRLAAKKKLTSLLSFCLITCPACRQISDNDVEHILGRLCFRLDGIYFATQTTCGAIHSAKQQEQCRLLAMWYFIALSCQRLTWMPSYVDFPSFIIIICSCLPLGFVKISRWLTQRTEITIMNDESRCLSSFQFFFFFL